MSRIANNPVEVPADVEVTLDGPNLKVKGSKGTLELVINGQVEINQDDRHITFRAANGTKKSGALAGTYRSLVNNMVLGVSKGFSKSLLLQGVGYRAQAQGKKLNLTLGFSHPIDYEIPDGIEVETPSQTEVLVKGIDKQLVGQVSAEIRAFRPPEPYKGKGVRYANEYVKRKDYLSGLKTFTNFRNVVMTRTFSKIYGLAGLRVGWGYGSKEIISALNKVKPPFNVSRPALFAASAAVKDSSWLNKEIKHVNKWSKKLFSEFKKMRIETNKSFTNFLLVKFDKVKINSAKVFRLLAKSGILVRKTDVYGIKNSLRVTIGTTSENITLIKKMRKILNVQ